MTFPCQSVQRADGSAGAIGSKVDVNRSGGDGFMPEQCLDCKQIRAVLVEMGAESMPEGMAGQLFLPTEPPLMLMDMAGQEKGVNRPVT